MKKNFSPVVLFVFFAGVAVSIAASLSIHSLEQKKLVRSFEKDALERISIIRTSLSMDTLTLEALRSFYYGSEKVSKKEFKNFVAPFFRRTKGLEALEWVPRVPFSDKEKFVAAARENGFHHFQITEHGPGAALITAQGRQEYYPVLYVEPSLGNEAALGFDVASSAARRKALRRAALTGKKTATGKIPLVLEKEHGLGFLVFVPVYKALPKGATATRQRHKPLAGFIVGVFRPKDIVEQSLAVLQPLGIDISLLDLSAPEKERLLCKYAPGSAGAGLLDNGPLRKSVSFRFCGRNWRLVCVADAAYLRQHASFTPWLALLLGCGFTGLLSCFTQNRLTETAKIKELVAEKTNELKKSEERLELAIEGADLGLWDWNIQTGSVYFNERWAGILGYRVDEIEPDAASRERLLHPDDKKQVLAALESHLRGEIPTYQTEHRLLAKNGKWKWVLERGKVCEWDDAGRPLRASGTLLDINERKQAEERVKHLASHDGLTNLPNRHLFMDHLAVALAGSRRRNSMTAVMFIDLDGFKGVNDRLGHDAGDLLLKGVAERLLACVRESDTVGRFGGDEFLVLLTDVNHREDAAHVADKILRNLAPPFYLMAKHASIGGSIGISLYPDNGKTPEELIKKADQAMYAVKNAGKNTYGFV